ncbi:MAG: hypothetical protein IK093_03550, partial [Ruminiclostridium sp.]|nr:hypothetical protein [Ruminiclostridium sp.]
MYIYQSGIIGEAVRTKIDEARTAVMTGERTNGESFGSLLRSLMLNTDREVKIVGITGTAESTSPVAHADGRTLLYAIANAENDPTASAVIGALGLPISNSGIKAAADGLTSAASLLSSAEGADKENVLPLLNTFVEKYNTLVTDLAAQSTTSGIMYSRLFSTAAGRASDALAAAGITVSDNGTLTLDADKFESIGIDDFLNSVSTAAGAV